MSRNISPVEGSCNGPDSLMCSGRGQCYSEACVCDANFSGIYCEIDKPYVDYLAGFKYIRGITSMQMGFPQLGCPPESPCLALASINERITDNYQPVGQAVIYSNDNFKMNYGAVFQRIMTQLASIPRLPINNTRETIIVNHGGTFLFPNDWDGVANIIVFECASYRNVFFRFEYNAKLTFEQVEVDGTWMFNKLQISNSLVKGALWIVSNYAVGNNFNITFTEPITFDPNEPFDGPTCTNRYTLCYGVLSNDASVCSGMGNCTGYNVCNCVIGMSGERCNISICNSTASDSVFACSGRGKCEKPETCNCTTNYFGKYCELTTCSKLTSNEGNVCSGRGECQDYNYCQCYQDIYGDNCQYVDCFGFRNTNDSVCSSHGDCANPNQCVCLKGFYGSNCEHFDCFGIQSNNSMACSSRGECNSLDNCTCQQGYFEEDCHAYSCYGIRFNFSNVCYGNGICSGFNTCNCKLGYYGDSCQYYNCSGIEFDNSTVCSSKGACTSPNNCSCEIGYYGESCQYYTCFGISFDNSSVCSSRGICSSPNNCTCEIGYFDLNCQASCYGISHTDGTVCSGHGTCHSFNNCSCANGFNGSACQLTSCYGLASTDPEVCSGRGSCNYYNNCTCDYGYLGINCSFYSCFGVINSYSSVCSGNGNCTQFDTCVCSDGFTGINCNITMEADGSLLGNISFSSNNSLNSTVNTTSLNETLLTNTSISSNDSSTYSVNSTLNSTTSLNDTLLTNTSDSSNSSIFSVNSTSLNDTILTNTSVNSNNSPIYSVNSASLNETTTINSTILANSTYHNTTIKANNTEAELPITQQNLTSTVNSTDSTIIGNNSIAVPNVSTIINTTFENSTITNSTNSTYSNISNSLRNNEDIDSNSTITNSTSFSNVSVQNQNPCLFTNFNSSLVCCRKGKCLDRKCSCEYGYSGSYCELKTCFGIPSSDPNVCNGRGKCVNVDLCECSSSNRVKINGERCEIMLCRGVYNGVEDFFSYQDSRVCSKHGKCYYDLSNNTGGCSCADGYYGDMCEQYDCFTEPSSSLNACSKHGKCILPNVCQCFSDQVNGYFVGTNCNSCHSAFTGSSCKEKACTISTCLNGGMCGTDNQCVCSGNFTGIICDVCKTDQFGSNCNVFCNAQTTCSRNGHCDSLDGKCICSTNKESGFWNGTYCNSCLVDYFGSDCLTHFESFNSFTNSSNLIGQVSKYFDGILFKVFGPSTYSQNSISCSKLVHPSDLLLLGSEPKCYWTEKLNGAFKIEFDTDFTFDISQTMILRLNTNVFSNSLPDHGFIRLHLILSENMQAPTASLKSSKTVYSTFENIYLSASNSFSGDRKGLEYYWSISGENVSKNVEQAVISTRDPILKIEKNQLTSGAYLVSLYVKSMVSKLISSSEFVSLQVQDVEFPSIIIPTKELSLKSTDKNIVIKKTTTIPVSLKEKDMKIEWQQVGGPIVQFRKDAYNNLIIEELSSGKQKYSFKVSITVIENPTLTSSDTVMIGTEQPNLSLSLSLKPSLNAGTLNSIQVNFQDPENNSEENEVWKWTCTDSETGGYCGDVIFQNLQANSKSRSTIISLSQQDFSSYVNKPTLSLAIYKGERSISNSLDLNIRHSPPLISVISILPSTRTIVTNNDKISIEIKHQEEDSTDSSLYVKTQWTINNFLVSESNTKKTHENQFETTSTSLKIPFKNLKNVNKNQQSSIIVDSLELEDGVDHSVQVKVSFVNNNTHQEVASSTSVNSFTKASIPRKCPCSVSPLTGISMQTDFIFTCENCQNEHNSIEIQQGYIDKETGIKVYLPLSQDNSVRIPSSSSGNGDNIVSLFIELLDTLSGESREMYSYITVMPPSQPTLSDIVNLVSNQTSIIMSTSIQDGDTAVSIADTLNSIVSASQLLQKLPSAEKEKSTITKVQSKLLDTLSSSLETTGETVSGATTSMTVLALHSVVKNESVIEKPIIQKSISILNHVVKLTIKSKVDIFTQSSKPLMSIIGILSNQVSKLASLKEEFLHYEEIASTLEGLTLSYVSVQPVSGDPASIHEYFVNVKADKMYLNDFTSSTMTTAAPNSKKRDYNYQSYFNIPQINVTESNEFAELTYSYIVKDYVPTFYQRQLREVSNNTTTNTTSIAITSSMEPCSVGVSVSISSPHAKWIDFPQNITVFVTVNDEKFSTLQDYACVLIDTNLESDFENCTVSGHDKETNSISCNCRFIDQKISNLIIVKQVTPKIMSILEQGLADEIIIVIVLVCVGFPLISIAILVSIIICCVCLKKKSGKINPYLAETRELISHNIERPSRIGETSMISLHPSNTSISLL